MCIIEGTKRLLKVLISNVSSVLTKKQYNPCDISSLILSPPESIMETCSVVLTFKSVNQILWCDHSNETSLAVLLYGTICFFNILQNEIWDFSGILFFSTLGS